MALDAEHCRKHAYHARKRAALTDEPDLKHTYETVAREFERLLAEFEEGKGAPTRPVRPRSQI